MRPPGRARRGRSSCWGADPGSRRDVKDVRVGQPASLPSDAFVALQAAARLGVRLPDVDSHSECERRVERAVFVEIVRGKPPAELDRHWHDLLERADEPNVFMHPRVIRAAGSDRRIVTLIAWETSGRERRLSGLWAFSIGKPHLSLIPVTALCAPATDHAYLSAPVIDRDLLEIVLHAMLDAVAAAPDLPKFVALESMSGAGATYQALLRVLVRRDSRSCHLDAKPRPILMPAGNTASYMQAAFSSSSRKKLRRHRRRLGELGQLQTTFVQAASDVRPAFEAFLALEMKGWKGQRGTAILNNPNEAAFARNLVAALAQAGDAFIYALALDGRPVGMQVVLRAGATVYTWKTAYDEALSDFSPGMLLFEDYSKAFLADPSIVFADSCAFDDSGYMAAWTERKLMIDLWLDARRGGSALFAAVAGLQRSYLPFRDAAKQTYLRSSTLQKLLRSAAAARRTMQRRGGATTTGRAEHFMRAF